MHTGCLITKAHIMVKCYRAVAKGFAQITGRDFNQIYWPLRTLDSVRTVIAKAASIGQHIHQVDMKTAFADALQMQN